MIIRSIELRNFRNYENLDIEFDEGTNILYGDNAQGKTNILEAAYMSGTTKSHKGSRDKEMIRFEQNEAHIRTVVEKNEKQFQIDMHLRRNGSKGVAINKIPIKKASELFGILNIVFFSPEDLNIIKNGPAERRRFIDLELCQLDKLYLSDLANYDMEEKIYVSFMGKNVERQSSFERYCLQTGFIGYTSGMGYTACRVWKKNHC